MKSTSFLRLLAGTALATIFYAGAATAAGPAVVSGPGADPDCFKPGTADTKYFQWPAKPGPYRIALANGFIANDWRVQMIKVAKAYANQPSVKSDIKEFKVVSVGQDVAAQIAAVNNFIDQGYDAIIVNANNSAAFGSVVKKANDAGVVLLSFDNIIDDPGNIQINVDQKGLGVTAGNFLPEGDQGQSAPSSCSCAVPPVNRSISPAPRALPRPSPSPAARSMSPKWSATGRRETARRSPPTPSRPAALRRHLCGRRLARRRPGDA